MLQGLDVYRKDYERMKIMIYGEHPSFNDIMDSLKAYEKKINLAIKKWKQLK